MSTCAQINANRANAQASTGPKSAAGKLASSCNSLRHGLCAKQLVLPGEDPADYDSLRQEIHTDYAPANTAEATLVDQIAQHTWRLQRVRRAETAMFDKLMANTSSDADLALAEAITDLDGELEKIRRYEVTIERSYHRAIEQLRKLQKERRARAEEEREALRLRMWVVPELDAEPGFVSQTAEQVAADELVFGSVPQESGLAISDPDGA